MNKLIEKVLRPLIGDLCRSDAISELVRDELWKRLIELEKSDEK